MPIQRITATTEVKPGQWALETPILIDALCNPPRLILKVSGTRIYTANRHGEDEGKFTMRKSFMFVCDTREEGLAVHAISEAHYEATRAHRKSLLAESTAKIAALIAGSAA